MKIIFVKDGLTMDIESADAKSSYDIISALFADKGDIKIECDRTVGVQEVFVNDVYTGSYIDVSWIEQR